MRIAITHLQDRLPIDRARVRHAVRAAAGERLAADAVNVAFVDDPAIRELNRRFLGRNCATDVIAFDYRDGAPDEDGVAGEIVISVDRALAEARRRRQPVERELLLYVVHGVLHLLGYDDREPGQSRRMRMEQQRVLKRLAPFVEVNKEQR